MNDGGVKEVILPVSSLPLTLSRKCVMVRLIHPSNTPAQSRFSEVGVLCYAINRLLFNSEESEG